MSEAKADMDLHRWLARVSQATGKQQLFKILDEFRPLTWTDNERSQMARHYIKILENLPEEDEPDEKEAQAPEGEKGDDGPVWYEKM